MIELKGKPSIKIEAKLLSSTFKAALYDCGNTGDKEDQRWIPSSICKFTPDRSKPPGVGNLVIQEWWYKKEFPNG